MARLIFIVFVSFLFVLNGNAQNTTILISTNLGDMKFRLYDDTPKHRDAFIELANEGYYNGTLFYRVLKDYLIQGGSKSSKNAAPGERIGYGDPDKTVDDEILPTHFHKKGALCAPRQPDEVNIFKQSDISQFFIVKGKVYTSGQIDTMELAVNKPIRNEIAKRIMTPEVREKLSELREAKKVNEFNELATQITQKIDAQFSLNTNTLEFSDEQREAYTTIGGTPELDGDYTVFGECISGFDVIDKIAALETDENNRPKTDVKITVTILSQ